MIRIVATPVRRKGERGSFLGFVAIISVCLVIAITSIIRVTQMSSSQTVYFESMSEASILAETGLNDAMSRLSTNPDPNTFDSSPVTVAPGKEYRNIVQVRTKPLNPIYYIVTSATHTVNGRPYVCQLHTYARVSNVSDYFLAVPDNLTVSHPVDVSEGKILASTITFIVDGDIDTLTKVKQAEYSKACFYQQPPSPASVWDSTAKLEVKITTPTTGEPTELTGAILFPQVLDSHLDWYKGLAGPHTVTCKFSGQIYPPGYSTYSGTNEIGDVYETPVTPGHTTDDKQHVYYCAGDIDIEGTVHGQVLFVAGGKINITGSLEVATDTNYPGAGEYGSKAHQTVLITRQNVVIKNKMVVIRPDVTVQKIQALIIAPQGTVIPELYPDNLDQNFLALDFTGSMVLQTLKTTPSFPTVFQAGRTYSYMNSLHTNPPPYLPAISEIFCALEETL